MTTERVSNPSTATKHYPVRYKVWDYRFPTDETIETLRFDDRYLHIELGDERILSIPLSWIPPLRDASPQELKKYQISEDRTLIFGHPDQTAINEVLRLTDYLHVSPQGS